MGFQILNSNGEAIAINELDKEAAAFWDKEVHSKSYATPTKPDPTKSELHNVIAQCGNWFDVIGHTIHSQGHYCSGWTNVVVSMIAENIGLKLIDTSTGYNDRPVSVAKFEPNPKCEGQISLPEKVEIGIYGVLAYYRPYIDLINHWQAKGYTPLKVQD